MWWDSAAAPTWAGSYRIAWHHSSMQPCSQSWVAAPLCCTPSCLHPAATLSQSTGGPGQGGGWNPTSPITQETET